MKQTMSRRRFCRGMSGILLTGLLGSCGSSGGAASSAQPEEETPVELVFTAVSVSGDVHTKAMELFAEKVRECSGGSVTCKTYADGTLFSSEEELDALLAGSAAGGADLAYLSFPTLAAQPGLEWCAMVSSAYFWTSYEQMSEALNRSAIGEEIFQRISDAVAVEPLSAFYLGVRCVNTTEREINSAADMEGLLLRMPEGEVWQELGMALGAEPVPLPFGEVYDALETMVIDGQENPLSTDVSAGFYRVTKALAMTNHVVDVVVPCMTASVWEGLSEVQRQAVLDAVEYARDVNDTARLAAEQDDLKLLEQSGLTITYPELEAFQAQALDYYVNHSQHTELWDWDLYNAIKNYDAAES